MGSLFHLLPCRAALGRKGCVRTSSGAVPMAMSASPMSGTVMERLTAQMAVMRLAVSNILILFPVSLRDGWWVSSTEEDGYVSVLR